MKMSVLILGLLWFASVQADAELILYETQTGAVIGTFEDTADVSVEGVKDSESSMSGINWRNISLGTGTVPPGATNISQVVDFQATTPEDEEADIERMPRKVKAAIRGLVKVINERLPAGQKITEPELRQAIKDEL